MPAAANSLANANPVGPASCAAAAGCGSANHPRHHARRFISESSPDHFPGPFIDPGRRHAPECTFSPTLLR